MRKQTFMRGTFVLTAAAFLTRGLGFFNGIMLARYLGQEGLGILMIATPLLPLFITITQLGLPVAISKLVSEAETQNDASKVRRILVVSLSVSGTLSTILTLLALFGSKWIASVFLPDPRAYYAMLAITPIIPIIAISGVLKGYFRGKQNMNPLAFSDIIENVVQIACVIGLVHYLLPYGIEYAAAGAMISAVIGEFAGLLYSFAVFQWSRKAHAYPEEMRPSAKPAHADRTLRDLLRIGIPMTGSGFIHSIYRAFLPTLITKSLLMSGVATSALATKQFGLLSGYVFPLLFLPGFFTQSLSTALVPAVSEAAANHNDRFTHRLMDLAIRTALFVGLPCTVMLCLWAVPLTTVVYRAPEAGPLLQLLAPLFFLYYFEAPLNAILLGLGRASTVMWNHLLANLFEAGAIFVLGSSFGIEGVALGIGFGICMLTFLHFIAVSASIGFYLHLRMVMQAVFAALVMAVCGAGIHSFMERHGFGLLWIVLGVIVVSVLVYIATLQVIQSFRIYPQREQNDKNLPYIM